MSVSQETDFSIQKATAAHSAQIKKLIVLSGLNPTSLNWQNFFVALDTGKKFIGCGQVKQHADGSMELASLAVKKEWRKQGVADALMQQLLIEHPRELYLMCQSSLGPLYEKYDFHAIQEAEMPKYFRRIRKLAGVLENLRKAGETRLIMRRWGNSSR